MKTQTQPVISKILQLKSNAKWIIIGAIGIFVLSGWFRSCQDHRALMRNHKNLEKKYSKLKDFNVKSEAKHQKLIEALDRDAERARDRIKDMTVQAARSFDLAQSERSKSYQKLKEMNLGREALLEEHKVKDLEISNLRLTISIQEDTIFEYQGLIENLEERNKLLTLDIQGLRELNARCEEMYKSLKELRPRREWFSLTAGYVVTSNGHHGIGGCLGVRVLGI